jgi:hypothetical protein
VSLATKKPKAKGVRGERPLTPPPQGQTRPERAGHLHDRGEAQKDNAMSTKLKAQKKRIKALQRNYDLYDNCQWHDPAKRDEYIRLAKAVAEAEAQ